MAGRSRDPLAPVTAALDNLARRVALLADRVEQVADRQAEHAVRLDKVDPRVDYADPQTYAQRRAEWAAEHPELAHLPAGSPEGQSAPPQFAEILTPGEVARALGIGDVGEAMSDTITAGDPDAKSRRSQKAHAVASLLSAMSRSGVVASYTDLPARPASELDGSATARERVGLMRTIGPPS